MTGPPNEDAPRADELVCMADNVSVRPDDPKCPHPSSFCRFREFCPVIEAIREKARRAPRGEPDEPGR